MSTTALPIDETTTTDNILSTGPAVDPASALNIIIILFICILCILGSILIIQVYKAYKRKRKTPDITSMSSMSSVSVPPRISTDVVRMNAVSQPQTTPIQKIKNKIAKHSPFKTEEKEFADHYNHLPSPKSENKRDKNDKKDKKSDQTPESHHEELYGEMVAINARPLPPLSPSKPSMISINRQQSKSPGSVSQEHIDDDDNDNEPEPQPIQIQLMENDDDGNDDSSDELYVEPKPDGNNLLKGNNGLNTKQSRVSFNETIEVNSDALPHFRNNCYSSATSNATITPFGVSSSITEYNKKEALFGETVEIETKPLPETPPLPETWVGSDYELSQISERKPTINNECSEYKHDELINIDDTYNIPRFQYEPGSISVYSKKDKPLPPTPTKTNDNDNDNEQMAKLQYGYSASTTTNSTTTLQNKNDALPHHTNGGDV